MTEIRRLTAGHAWANRAKMGLCGPLQWQPAGWRIGS